MLDCLVDGVINDVVQTSDRGLNYGDGLFETLAVRRGFTQFWQSHMDRLEEGCERLYLRMPPQALLLREVRTVSAGLSSCVVKISLTRGSSGRGYAADLMVEPHRIVSAHAMPEGIDEMATAGIRTRICKLRLGVQPALGGIKHLNRLEQVLARAEWSDPHIHEGILMDPEDHVISGVSSNLFMVTGDSLLTPRLDRCGVRGVMRSQVLKAYAARTQQRRITIDMLPEADEVFLCNSVRGIIPVRSIDQWHYEIGPVTRELQAWLSGLQSDQ
jgi:4-amino-4-deoxychorismate lyase